MCQLAVGLRESRVAAYRDLHDLLIALQKIEIQHTALSLELINAAYGCISWHCHLPSWPSPLSAVLPTAIGIGIKCVGTVSKVVFFPQGRDRLILGL